MIHVGTSGWVYADWRGRFYPRDLAQRRWLSYYADRFSTVELNNSFYRLPAAVTFRAWRAEVPADFVFAVKASRFITHIKRLREGREPNKLLMSRARALGSRLGPILYQTPPRFPPDVARLRAFLRTVPHPDRAAFEFRDPRWHVDEVFEALDEVGAAFVLADTPRARVPEVVCGGWSYVRFHKGRERAPGYRRDKLRRWADRLVEMRARELYVYFNNDQDGAAIRDSLAMIELLEDTGVRVA